MDTEHVTTIDEAKNWKLGTKVRSVDDVAMTGVVISREPHGIGIQWHGLFPVREVILWSEVYNIEAQP